MFLLTLAHIKALSQITAKVICKQLKDKTCFHKKPHQKNVLQCYCSEKCLDAFSL